ncbi:MAG: S-adenosylmethionine synthase [candidate division BRC1 bacterium ADurb.Bin183]|nr:MAG: S-adenosylmethionine synthase [candidate division BRC1 bacterium ADurb.Bin183]
MTMTRFFTSESVSEGHPDKVCDQISDAVLDAVFEQDKNGRCACECFVTTGLALVGGEITCGGWINFEQIARDTIKKIGYTDSSMGFDSETCCVLTAIRPQSPDIAMGVVKKNKMKQGAGDQGMMFGFACNETPELMPMPIMMAHKLVQHFAKLRKNGTIKWACPDSKSQVTVQYDGSTPIRIDSVVISTQHFPDVAQTTIREEVIAKVIKPTLPKNMLDENTKYHVNPTGRFVKGGPHGDTGLTGRKIIVDTYGGYSRHGGGAFSGKDPSKVDRSAAYFARWVAKNIVASGAAQKCEIQVAYAIGVADPLSIYVDTFGTGKISDEKLVKIVKKNFDFRPAAIIERLDLKRPIYFKTSAYGHFGRNEKEFTWEKTDMVNVFKNAL